MVISSKRSAAFRLTYTSFTIRSLCDVLVYKNSTERDVYWKRFNISNTRTNSFYMSMSYSIFRKCDTYIKSFNAHLHTFVKTHIFICMITSHLKNIKHSSSSKNVHIYMNAMAFTFISTQPVSCCHHKIPILHIKNTRLLHQISYQPTILYWAHFLQFVFTVKKRQSPHHIYPYLLWPVLTVFFIN